jgi:hypothetical protein
MWAAHSQNIYPESNLPFIFQVIPTIIMIKDAQTRGYVVGFTDLGNTDDFTTEMLEWRIAHVRIFLSYPMFWTVLRIRDVYPGSEFFHPGSRDKIFRIQI